MLFQDPILRYLFTFIACLPGWLHPNVLYDPADYDSAVLQWIRSKGISHIVITNEIGPVKDTQRDISIQQWGPHLEIRESKERTLARYVGDSVEFVRSNSCTRLYERGRNLELLRIHEFCEFYRNFDFSYEASAGHLYPDIEVIVAQSCEGWPSTVQRMSRSQLPEPDSIMYWRLDSVRHLERQMWLQRDSHDRPIFVHQYDRGQVHVDSIAYGSRFLDYKRFAESSSGLQLVRRVTVNQDSAYEIIGRERWREFFDPATMTLTSISEGDNPKGITYVTKFNEYWIPLQKIRLKDGNAVEITRIVAE